MFNYYHDHHKGKNPGSQNLFENLPNDLSRYVYTFAQTPREFVARELGQYNYLDVCAYLYNMLCENKHNEVTCALNDTDESTLIYFFNYLLKNTSKKSNIVFAFFTPISEITIEQLDRAMKLTASYSYLTLGLQARFYVKLAEVYPNATHQYMCDLANLLRNNSAHLNFQDTFFYWGDYQNLGSSWPNFQGANFKNTAIINADFRSICLDRTNFENALLYNAKFNDSNLCRTNFNNASFVVGGQDPSKQDLMSHFHLKKQYLLCSTPQAVAFTNTCFANNYTDLICYTRIPPVETIKLLLDKYMSCFAWLCKNHYYLAKDISNNLQQNIIALIKSKTEGVQFKDNSELRRYLNFFLLWQCADFSI